MLSFLDKHELVWLHEASITLPGAIKLPRAIFSRLEE
jgi:hypothetical protein